MNREERRAHAARDCYCGSGKKYRNCHEVIEQETISLFCQQAEVAAATLPNWWPPSGGTSP